jgi:hypothetical protein
LTRRPATNPPIGAPGEQGMAAKSYQLTIDKKPGYWHFRVTGPNTPEVVRAYLADVYYACAQSDCTSILVEENLSGKGLGLFDIFEVVTEGSEKTWPHIRRIAFVDVNPDHSSHDMKFAETVAVNRGVNVHVFCSVAEAQAWLTGVSDNATARP